MTQRRARDRPQAVLFIMTVLHTAPVESRKHPKVRSHRTHGHALKCTGVLPRKSRVQLRTGTNRGGILGALERLSGEGHRCNGQRRMHQRHGLLGVP